MAHSVRVRLSLSLSAEAHEKADPNSSGSLVESGEATELSQ